MAEMTFTQLNQQITQHFAAQEYQAGLVLATQNLTNFPEEFALLNYWRVCLAARLEAYEQANKILEDTLSSGIWYAEAVLRQSPSLAALQDQAEFERLVGISLQMQAADPSEQMPLLVARPDDACGPEQPSCPAVMFLHGNQDTAPANLEQWSSLPGLGWLLALPQSKNVLWAGAHAWTSHEEAAKEVAEHYAALSERYSLNPDGVILAGFSMGAEVALAMALRGDIEVQGFILIGPGGPYMDNLEEWQPVFAAAGRKLRGLIIMGLADDAIPQDNVRTLVEMLNAQGHSTELKSYPGLAHEYPADFEATLAYALKYIMG